jgi:hypothetical protein
MTFQPPTWNLKPAPPRKAPWHNDAEDSKKIFRDKSREALAIAAQFIWA